MSLGSTGLIARRRNIRTLPSFSKKLKIKWGQSFATKTSLFMFIQVKDWKNEGQDVALTACSQSVLQSVNPQSSSLHLNPKVVAVQIFPNPALRSTQQVQIKAERCKTLWCEAEFIFSLTLNLAALQSRKHQNINSSILSELPWRHCQY